MTADATALGRPGQRRSPLARLDEALADLAGADIALVSVTPDEIRARLLDGLWWDACAEGSRTDPERVRQWYDGEDTRIERILAGQDPTDFGPYDAGESTRAIAAVAVAAADGLPGGLRDRARRDAEAYWSAAGVLPFTATTPSRAGERDGYRRSAAAAFVELAVACMASDPAPPVARREVRILFDTAPGEQAGRTGTLRLVLLPGGPPGLYPDPRTMSFLRADMDFRESLSASWTYAARAAAPRCVLWHIEQEGDQRTPISGNSLGAAFAVALAELLGHRRARSLSPLRFFRVFRTQCAITGSLTADGVIGPVGGLPGKFEAARRRTWSVVVPEANWQAAVQLRGHGLRIFPVSTVRQARRRVQRWVPTRMIAVGIVPLLALSGYLVSRARADTEQAIEHERLAQRARVVRELLDQADALSRDQTNLATRLDLAAAAIEDSPQTRAALVNRLITVRPPAVITPGQGPVTAVAYGPGGTLVTADQSGATLWDISEPARPRRRYSPLIGSTVAGATATSSDGRTVLIAGRSSSSEAAEPLVTIWNAADSARPSQSQFATCDTTALAYSEASRLAAVACADGTLTIWNLADPARPVNAGVLVRGTGAIHAVAFNKTGTMVAVAAQQGAALYSITGAPSGRLAAAVEWSSAETPKRPGLPAPGPAYAAAFGDGPELVIGWSDGTSEMVRVQRGRWMDDGFLAIAGQSGAVRAVDVRDAGKTVLVGGDGNSAVVWRQSATSRVYEPFAVLHGHEGSVITARFAADGSTAVTGSRDGTVRLWDLRDADQYRRIGTMQGQRGSVEQIMVRGTVGVTVTGDGATVWDLATIKQPNRVAGLHPATGKATSVVLRSDGSAVHAVTTDEQGGLTGWDLTTPATPREEWSRPPDTVVAQTLGLSADGRLLAAGGAGGVVLLNSTDPAEPTQASTFGTGPIIRVAFDSGGGYLAVAKEDGTTEIWDVRKPDAPHLVQRLPSASGPSRALAFAPSARTLTRSEGRDPIVTQFDLADASALKEITSMRGHQQPVEVVAYSDDGTMLVTASRDATAMLWSIVDPFHPHLLAVLTGHTAPLRSAAFGGDQGTVITGDEQGGIIVWDVSGITSVTADPRTAACRAAGGSLSETDWSRYPSRILPYVDGCQA
ncbi:hypothetical protein [Dactylosporangium sp. CA-092794]|uniref:hypothetical protein n=1 Tax=Dactylosporangium sp. CA-092794 TaxID=3239929 RepID=UPI003D8E896C